MAGWFNLGFLDNADHKDLKATPQVGSVDRKVSLKKAMSDAGEGDDAPKARTADVKSDDKGAMSQASFSGYK